MSNEASCPPEATSPKPEASRLVAIVTFNEIENLPSLVAEIHRQVPDCDVLVVDDNSPDGTGQWCREFQEGADWFHCLHRQGKLGLGSAVVDAIHWASERNYRYLATLDADWSHPPAKLPELFSATVEADVVIGSRYCQGGSIEGWSWKRRWASRVNNWLSHHLLGLPSRDNSGNCRVYDLRQLAKIDLSCLRSDGYAFLEEILWLLHRQDARLAEVPIVFTNRVRGDSKIGLGEILGKLATLLRLLCQRAIG